MRARNMFLLAASMLFAASAQAAPINYVHAPGGQVTITATVAGNPIAPAVVIATTGGNVTLNEPSSIPFLLINVGSAVSIPITGFGGYTSLNIDFASLTATGGTLSLFDAGPPAGYNYTIPNVAVSGEIDAVNTNPFLSVNNVPFGYITPSASGQVYADTGVAIALDGITIGSITVLGQPIVLKADFLFLGVPEPGTAILLGLGLAGVAARRRSA